MNDTNNVPAQDVGSGALLGTPNFKTTRTKMNAEDALNIADSGDRTETDPLAVLAAEVRRLRGLHEKLQNHNGAIILSRYEEGYGNRHEAFSLKYPDWRTQPAARLGANYSEWGGHKGHDYMEIHWPDKHPLQLILRPDEGELFGFIKVEQTAMNHWRLLRA